MTVCKNCKREFNYILPRDLCPSCLRALEALKRRLANK